MAKKSNGNYGYHPANGNGDSIGFKDPNASNGDGCCSIPCLQVGSFFLFDLGLIINARPHF